MNPSQLRRNILSEHVLLRGKLSEVEAALRKVAQGEHADDAQLRGQVQQFVKSFLDHIEMENASLVPMLQGIDAWGQIRAEQVARDHDWQRAALTRLADEAKLGSTAEIVRMVETLAKQIREDIEHEEETVLSPNLLRDDPIAIDQADG